MARKFSSTSVETTLASDTTTSATTITVATGTGNALMGGQTLGSGNVDQFALVINPDTVSEEIVWATGISSDTLTVVRARGGTAGVAHLTGAKVKHVVTGEDLSYFETGLGGALTAASTSTVTNKTINLASNTLSGTTAEFNSALSDDNFATLTNSVTLTNKTLTSPTITTPVSSIAINAQTAAYTLVSGDKSKLVTINSATTANLTVPLGVFSAGDVIYVARLGAGAMGIVGAAGTTISATPGTSMRAQNSVGAIICTASNTFLLAGDISQC